MKHVNNIYTNMHTKQPLTYKDNDGVTREITNCRLTADKQGRYWLWCDALDRNLSHRMETREDALLGAISNLLFILSLRDRTIEYLREIEKLASDFANRINPEMSDDY